jgi:hypothetical protein
MFWRYWINYFSNHGHFPLQVLQLPRFVICNFSHILLMPMVHPFPCFTASYWYSDLFRMWQKLCISLAAFWPHAYTVQLAEERNSRNANSYSVRPTEIETVNIPGQGGITLRDTLNDVESGSRSWVPSLSGDVLNTLTSNSSRFVCMRSCVGAA